MPAAPLTTPPDDDNTTTTPAQPTRPAGRPTTPAPPDDDNTTTSPGQQRACPVCGTRFTRIRRQRFCSDNCRKTAWARTRAVPTPDPVPVPPRGQRLNATIYACGDCGTRYHAIQWCPDCNTPCTRVGPGGPCPHCHEPVTITDLTPQGHDMPS